MPLTARRQRFVEEYPIDLNGTQAAIRAGFSKKTAASQAERLLRNVDVKTAIDAKLKKRAERLELNADYVLDGIRQLVERCIQAEPVMDKEGNETGEYKFDAHAGLKGYELLGKHLKLFTDKVEQSGSAELLVRVEHIGRSAG